MEEENKDENDVDSTEKKKENYSVEELIEKYYITLNELPDNVKNFIKAESYVCFIYNYLLFK